MRDAYRHFTIHRSCPNTNRRPWSRLVRSSSVTLNNRAATHNSRSVPALCRQYLLLISTLKFTHFSGDSYRKYLPLVYLQDTQTATAAATVHRRVNSLSYSATARQLHADRCRRTVIRFRTNVDQNLKLYFEWLILLYFSFTYMFNIFIVTS